MSETEPRKNRTKTILLEQKEKEKVPDQIKLSYFVALETGGNIRIEETLAPGDALQKIIHLEGKGLEIKDEGEKIVIEAGRENSISVDDYFETMEKLEAGKKIRTVRKVKPSEKELFLFEGLEESSEIKENKETEKINAPAFSGKFRGSSQRRSSSFFPSGFPETVSRAPEYKEKNSGESQYYEDKEEDETYARLSGGEALTIPDFSEEKKLEEIVRDGEILRGIKSVFEDYTVRRKDTKDLGSYSITVAGRNYEVAGNSALAIIDRRLREKGLTPKYKESKFEIDGKVKRGIYLTGIKELDPEAEKYMGEKENLGLLFFADRREPYKNKTEQLPADEYIPEEGERLSLAYVSQGTYRGNFGKAERYCDIDSVGSLRQKYTDFSGA